MIDKMDGKQGNISEHEQLRLPVLPLRDVTILPGMKVPLFIGREKSIVALEEAMKQSSNEIFVVAQKESQKDDPVLDDLYQVGTIAEVLQMLKLPDGTIKILVEGLYPARCDKFEIGEQECPWAELTVLEVEAASDPTYLGELETALVKQFKDYLETEQNVQKKEEILRQISEFSNDLSKVLNLIAAFLDTKMIDRQSFLEELGIVEKATHLLTALNKEEQTRKIQKRIQQQVKSNMDVEQKKYVLKQQEIAIKKELSELDEGEADELDVLEKDIKKLPEEARESALSELKKLRAMPPMAAEASVVRNYIDWLLKMPWDSSSTIKHDIPNAEAMLDAEHFGLEKVKERILEYLAVEQRLSEKHSGKKGKVPTSKSNILCLVGPPGVGKTSLGESIAKATGREFIRISLGGMRDEAEVRGHRRTYIGAMPGKIIQQIARAGVKNPLILLDEIDKIGMDFRGDPASALLEVLDPEQNETFSDHYLEVDYDLSNVMFITTANSLNIPGPLLDRMELLRLPGYTEDEKMHIAKQYLVPKRAEANGLDSSEIDMSGDALLSIIRYYTREAGVRSLEREIDKVCRKVVRQAISKKKKKKTFVGARSIEKYLGVKRFDFGVAGRKDKVGQVTGLAWTEAGGDLLTIEATFYPGKGAKTLTGNLGDVMQESIQAAMTVVRTRSVALDIQPKFYEKHDVHIHVPEGATPKDGPSAGIGMSIALISSLLSIPVRSDVAMTGEITLRGEVLKIGGLKEKLLAAKRGSIKQVIIPKGNQADLKEISENILEGLTIHAIQWIDEAIEIALAQHPGYSQRLQKGLRGIQRVDLSKSSSDQTSDRAH